MNVTTSPSEINWSKVEYPLEVYVSLESDQEVLIRITLNYSSQKYHAEIDLVEEETRKIRRHLTTLFSRPAPDECLQEAYQYLHSSDS